MGKWINPWNGVAPSSTPRCSSYWKGSRRVTLDWGRQFYLFVSQNVEELWASHSPRLILFCAYTNCTYGQILILCTIHNGLPSPPCHVLSYTLLRLICSIHLLYNWSFRLYHLLYGCVLTLFRFNIIGPYGVSLCCN